MTETAKLIAGTFRISEKSAEEILSKIPDWQAFGWNALKYEVRLILRG